MEEAHEQEQQRPDHEGRSDEGCAECPPGRAALHLADCPDPDEEAPNAEDNLRRR
ncbi:MAG: hypothetical protein HY901_35920 [Deltaproteobacteria bacterium]|nr:hypothetical protein [Deltaproteobacteria bacterium]